MLSNLIDDFERACNDLLMAVRRGDESAVNQIDAEIQPLMHTIFRQHARNRDEITLQLEFFARLAVRNCEDDVGVRRYTGMMKALFDRYLPSAVNPDLADTEAGQGALSDGYDASLHEMLLDSVPERVAVVGLDYRYLYTNQPNADFHLKRPSDFIGKSLVDVMPPKLYHSRAKPRLDQCFAGARVHYNYETTDAAGRMYDVRCRMTPFIGPSKAIAGAVIVLTMQPMFAPVA